MAATRFIEEESGSYRGHRSHRHNGYHAGDFSTAPLATFGPTRLATSSWR
jgi:hypothetical protein